MCLKQHHWTDEEKKGGGGNTDIHSIIQTPSVGHSISLVATHKYKHICKSGRRRASRDQPNPSHPIPYSPSSSSYCNYSPSINWKLRLPQVPVKSLPEYCSNWVPGSLNGHLAHALVRFTKSSAPKHLTLLVGWILWLVGRSASMFSAPGARLRSALETLLARSTKRLRKSHSKVSQLFSRSRGVGGEKKG